jgi:hypothetical protein
MVNSLRNLLITILFLCLAQVACAGTVTLSWDPMPPTESWTMVRVYEISGTPPSYTKILEVSPSQNTVTLTNVKSGSHTYIVRSFDGISESQDSNTASKVALPNPPSNLK